MVICPGRRLQVMVPCEWTKLSHCWCWGVDIPLELLLLEMVQLRRYHRLLHHVTVKKLTVCKQMWWTMSYIYEFEINQIIVFSHFHSKSR